MSPIDPYLGAQAPAQDFIRTFLDREIPAGLLFYAPFLPQTGNQAWAADKRIVVPTVETVDADGSYFASDGLIRRARANALRMEGLGGLIEGARTNVCLQSEVFEPPPPPWTKVNTTIQANVTPSPNGASTADKVVENNANGLHDIWQSLAAGNYTLSVFAKQGERNWIHIIAGGPNSARYFNLATGAMGGTGGWAAPLDSGIERLPGGWFRCWIQDNAITAFYVVLALADGGGAYLGDGTSGVYVWGAQAEVGTFPTSYIPTVAAAVVRSRENIQYSNAGQVHCQAAAGTLIVAVTVIEPVTNAYITDTYSNAPFNSGFLFNIMGGPLYRAVHYSGGVIVANLQSITVPAAGVTHILATAWQVNDFRLYVDGNLEASDALGAAPTGINAILYIGQDRGSAVSLWGNLSHWCYYNHALTTAEIAQRSHFLHNQMARAS